MMKKAVYKLPFIHLRPFLLIFVSLFLGVTLSLGIFGLDVISFIVFGGCFATFLVVSILQKKASFVLIFCVAFCVGLFYSQIKINSMQQSEVYDQEMQISGQVRKILVQGDCFHYYVLKNVTADGESIPDILVGVSSSEKLVYEVGQILTFNSALTLMQLKQGTEYNTYAITNDYSYQAGNIKSQNITISQGSLSLAEKIRKKVYNVLSENLSEDTAGIAYAMLFGEKLQIDSTTYSNFKSAGIVHVLAVSGLHVGFLYGMLIVLLKKLKVNKYVILVSISAILLFYMYVCGFAPSIMRAGIMACVAMIANCLGEKNEFLTTIGIAGTLMILINPMYCINTGFKLSYLSVLGIGLLAPVFSQHLQKHMTKSIANAISSSLAVSFFTFPILSQIGGTFSPWIIISNILVIAYFGFLFPYLFVATLIATVFPFMSFLLALANVGLVGLVAFVKFINSLGLQFKISSLNVLSVFLIDFLLVFVSHTSMIKAKTKLFVCSLFFMLIGVSVLCQNLSAQTECCNFKGEVI